VSAVIIGVALLGTAETVGSRRNAQDRALQSAVGGAIARIEGSERQMTTAAAQLGVNPAVRGLLGSGGAGDARRVDALEARQALASFEGDALVPVSAACIDGADGRQLVCGPGERSASYPRSLGRRFATVAALSPRGAVTSSFTSPVDAARTVAFVMPIRVAGRLVGLTHFDVADTDAQAVGRGMVAGVTVRLASYAQVTTGAGRSRARIWFGSGEATSLPRRVGSFGRHPTSLLRGTHRSMIAAWPLRVGGTRQLAVVATALAQNPNFLNAWTPEMLVLLALGAFTLLGSLTALVLANRRLQRELCTDSLTGLRNRRALLAELPRVCERASEAQPAYLWFFDLNGFKRYNDSFGHLAGDVLLRRLGSRLQAAVSPSGSVFRLGGDEFCAVVATPVADPHGLFLEAREALCERGGAFTVTASAGAVEIPRETADPTHALRLADHHMYRDKAASQGATAELVTAVLHAALAQRHPELDEHSSDVAGDVELLSRTIGLDDETVEDIIRAGDLHDVGKLGIPDEIITKPGPLSDGEWQFMRQHTVMGERIIAAAGPSLERIAPLVRASHERWDGKGYPDGVAGEAIPLGARIISICDSFRAMLSERPYKKPMCLGDALAELRRCAGTQFDPALVEVFCGLVVERSLVPEAPAANV
jgi:diguanylate cyclase (GGDEF)-like protein